MNSSDTLSLVPTDSSVKGLKSFAEIENCLNILMSTDLTNPDAFLIKSKLKQIQTLTDTLKHSFRSLESEAQELSASYEGKLAYIEEELQESEKTCSAQKEKIRVLISQLSTIQEEYNQLNEDFTSTLQMLNDQITAREKAQQAEEIQTGKINQIIKKLNDELSSKSQELEALKKNLEKKQETGETLEDPKKSLENLEKKYKSLEALYMQQLQINTGLREDSRRMKEMEEKCKELQEKLDDVTRGVKVSGKLTIDLASVDLKNEFEIKSVMERNEEYQFQIIMLNRKINELQEALKNSARKHEVTNEILEISDQLLPNDYELTKSLDLNDSLTPESNQFKQIVIESYSELSKYLKEKGLVADSVQSDYLSIKSCCEKLSSIQDLLLKHLILSSTSQDPLESLEKYLQHKSEVSFKNKSADNKPTIVEDFESNINFSEPSPRNTYRLSNGSAINEIKFKDAKILSKKMQINLHKEQIRCLKQQLREVEANLKASESIDTGILKGMLKQLFEDIPKLSEKAEKEIDICMCYLGFHEEDIKGIRATRLKPSRFRLFR